MIPLPVKPVFNVIIPNYPSFELDWAVFDQTWQVSCIWPYLAPRVIWHPSRDRMGVKLQLLLCYRYRVEWHIKRTVSWRFFRSEVTRHHHMIPRPVKPVFNVTITNYRFFELHFSVFDQTWQVSCVWLYLAPGVTWHLSRDSMGVKLQL